MKITIFLHNYAWSVLAGGFGLGWLLSYWKTTATYSGAMLYKQFLQLVTIYLRLDQDLLFLLKHISSKKVFKQYVVFFVYNQVKLRQSSN